MPLEDQFRPKSHPQNLTFHRRFPHRDPGLVLTQPLHLVIAAQGLETSKETK